MKEQTIPNDARRRALAGRVADALEYLLLLAVLLECNSVYTCARETASAVDMYRWFYLLALGLGGAALVLRVAMRPKEAGALAPYGLVLAALIIWAMAFYALNVRGLDAWKRRNYQLNFLMLLPLFTALFKVKQRSGEGLDLLFKHSDIAYALAALSLVVFLAAALRPGSVPLDTIYTSWNNTASTIAQDNWLDVCQAVRGAFWHALGIALPRNRSLMGEPLMFALPLVIALFTEMFLRPRGAAARVWRWVLLSAALVSANATIGLMLMTAAWGLKAVWICVDKKKRLLIVPIVLAGLCAVGAFWAIKSRAPGDAGEEAGSSLRTHLDDYAVTARAFANRPLLGGGYQDETYIRAFMSPERQAVNPGLSNTAGVVLAEGGMMLGTLCMLPFGIWLMYLLRKRDRRVALWAVGALGVYVGIIFKYHQLLMLLMAFGYSLLDVGRTERGRLALGLCPVTASAEPQVRRPRGLGAAIVVAGVVVCAWLVFFGAPVWSALHAFLRGHQFSVGQSPLRSFCFAVALVLNGACVRRALRGDCAWPRLVALLIWDAVYLLAYPALFSSLNTWLTLRGVWGELRECGLLLAAWLVPAAAVMLVEPRRWRNLRGAVAAVAIAAVAVPTVLIARGQIGRYVPEDAALVPALENLAASASGKVYVDDMPMYYAQRVQGVSPTSTRRTGYEVLDNANVVLPKGATCRDLLDSGFRVAALTDDYMLCTNDAQAMAALSAQGTAFCDYDPFPHAVDLADLAERNGLSTTPDGAAIVDGPIESLSEGPYASLLEGMYFVVFDLHIDPRLRDSLPPESRVCGLTVSAYGGLMTYAYQDVPVELFDGAGDVTMNVPIWLGAVASDVEYRVSGGPDVRVEVRGISVRQASPQEQG